MPTPVHSSASTSAPGTTGCGCPEGRAVMGQVTRRAVLGGAGAVGLAVGFGQVFGPEAATHYAYADGGYSGDTIVVPAGSTGHYWAPTYARLLGIYGPNPTGADSQYLDYWECEDS